MPSAAAAATHRVPRMFSERSDRLIPAQTMTVLRGTHASISTLSLDGVHFPLHDASVGVEHVEPDTVRAGGMAEGGKDEERR
eukprot:233534-Hanusia_phi.AAC.1